MNFRDFRDDALTKVKLFLFKLKHFNWSRFTKGEKIFTVVTALVLVLASVAVVLDVAWIKPPDVTPGPDGGNDIVDTNGEDDVIPSYIDQMPSLSGDRKNGVYTFLLIGTDKGGGNTDTLMLVTYDVPNKQVNIASIPRDTMINGSWDIKKINSAYSVYKDGIGALKRYVKSITGFEPDFYAKIDLSAFVELVDLIGGVDFYVPQDMKYSDPYQDLYIDLKEGQQKLNGEKAMQLVRVRSYPNGDIGRVEVQQAFIKALIKQCISIQNWSKIKGYIDLVAKYVETDMELGEMLYFASEGLKIDFSTINTFTLPGNYGATCWSRALQRSVSYVTLYPDQLVEMINQYFNPYLTDVSKEFLDIMIVNKDGTISCTSGNLQDQKHNVQYLAWVEAQKQLEEEANNPDDPVDPDDSGATTQPGTEGTGDAPGTVVPPIDSGAETPQPGENETPADPGTSDENWDWIFQ